MLTYNKTSIETRIPALLFTFISMIYFSHCCFAVALDKQELKRISTLPGFSYSIDFNVSNQPDYDTVKTENVPQNQLNIPDEKVAVPIQLANKILDFTVNSDITYLQFKNFVQPEARITFLEAWEKENEVKRLSAQSDSLRNVYANSSDNRKQELAARILKNEAKTMALNEEIPQLYQKARNIENQYWQTVSEDKLTRFQEKINLIRDSLAQVSNQIKAREQHLSQDVPDTIIMVNPEVQMPIQQNAQSSGIIYKIQIASFKTKLPASITKLLKKLSVIRQIENYKDDKGVTIYTTGNLRTWKEAVTMLKQVKQEGVKNPTIVAYQNEKKIDVNEARKITNEL